MTDLHFTCASLVAAGEQVGGLQRGGCMGNSVSNADRRQQRRTQVSWNWCKAHASKLTQSSWEGTGIFVEKFPKSVVSGDRGGVVTLGHFWSQLPGQCGFP